MHTCKQCGKEYSLDDVFEALFAMGMAPMLDPVDQDYLVLIYGLCPDCWPEYDEHKGG